MTFKNEIDNVLDGIKNKKIRLKITLENDDIIIFDKGWIVATDYRINRNIVSLRFDSNVIAEIHVIKIIRIE